MLMLLNSEKFYSTIMPKRPCWGHALINSLFYQGIDRIAWPGPAQIAAECQILDQISTGYLSYSFS